MQYEHAKKSVKERKEYGEDLRKTLLNLMPAAINKLAKETGRSRTSINHHFRLMREQIACDKSHQPHTYYVLSKQ